MLSKKWLTVVGAALLTGVLATGAALAAGGQGLGLEQAAAKLSPGVREVITEIHALRQSRMEQMKAEIDALVDKATAEGKITPEEAARLKEGGKRLRHGKDHAPGERGLKGAPGSQGGPKGKGFGKFKHGTEAEVKARLDAAVKAGRLTQEQADQILERWRAWQTKQRTESQS